MKLFNIAHIHRSQMRAARLLSSVIVEIVDAQEKIDAFLTVLDGMMSSGLITMEKVQVLQYGSAKP
jgi:uncharacterized protein